MKKNIIIIFLLTITLSIFLIINKDKIKCESEWKSWEKVWKAQMYTCINYYKDWWNECNSSNDCKWYCIQKNINSKPFCEKSDNRFGCWNSVENIAKWEGILCID